MNRIQEEMNRAVAEGIFPGAALLVASMGDILFRDFFGSATLLPQPERITEESLFDIASLTKPVVTASLALLAIALPERGLSMNGTLAKYLPGFDENVYGEEKKRITIRHLLKHTSGLPSWKPYFQEIAREHPEVVGHRKSQPYYLSKILHESLETPVAYQKIYSDLGYILLGMILEHLWEAPLDQVFKEKISIPLGMNHTFFVPSGSSLPFPRSQFVATENSEWRQKLLRGEVHDDNAYTLGGVAGHAGLFSTVDDLHRFLIAFERGYREQSSIFLRDMVDLFVGEKTKVKLGWDIPSLENSQAGKYFSRNTIGHLGYTGCSFWADLDNDYHVILLTNRVHPTSQNEAIKTFRPLIHDVIYEVLLKR